MKRKFRKPLIVMIPKSLLRHKLAVSSVADLVDGAFHEVLDETAVMVKAAEVRHLLFCSGKVYYDLLVERERRQQSDVAIVRLEQLYPFSEKQVQAVLNRYPHAQDVVWVQEEPRNMGAWTFIAERLSSLLRTPQSLRYAGRTAQASPAVGFQKIHQQEQTALIDQALAGK
jgi:2-oxoglutarate dehydrogenase E1 component